MRERPEGHSHLDQFRVRWRCFSVAVIVLVHIVGMLLFRRKFGEAQVSRTGKPLCKRQFACGLHALFSSIRCKYNVKCAMSVSGPRSP